MARDDFTAKTKLALAMRVGHRCSFPDCRTPTVGPSATSTEKVAQSGRAAHISAASPLGPRYDATMTTAQRKHIDNGIWMCAHHASLIDDDKDTYSRKLLIEWKLQAEARAKIQQEFPGRTQSHSLALGEKTIDELAKKIDLVQQTLLDAQNPIGDLNSVSVASFVQKKYPHSSAILTVNAETGGTTIRFQKTQTVNLTLPASTARSFREVVAQTKQGRSGAMDWSDLNIIVDATDPILNEALAPGRGKRLRFVPTPIKIRTTLYFRVARNDPLAVVCEYTITPDDGPVIIQPIVSSTALKFEWVLEKHNLRVNYHLDAKNISQAPFQFSDLPLLKLLEQLGTTSGKFSIAIGNKTKTFAEVYWRHRTSDQIALWSNLARLYVEANTNLRILGLIDEDLPWPNPDENLNDLIFQLQRVLKVLVSRKRHQELTITLDLNPSEPLESWNVKLREKAMHVMVSSNVEINGHAYFCEQVDMNPATVRFFDGDIEIFAESIGAAMAQCAGQLTLELSSPKAKLTFLRIEN